MCRTVALDLLSSIRVASPCTADWDQMVGDDQKRFCSQCNLNVYNLSAMPAEEAAAFVEKAEGRVCIRLYKRADGTVITQDCPVGLRLLRKKAAKAARRIVTAAALLASGCLAFATSSRNERTPRLATLKPFSTIRELLSPTAKPPPAISAGFILGDYCPVVKPVPAPAAKGK